VVSSLASEPPVDDDTEVHEAAAAAPSGGARRLEQRSAVRGGAEWAEAWRLSRKRRGTGLGVATTRDKGVARTWWWWLQGLRVERRWRAVDSAGARWQAGTKPPQCRRARVGVRRPGHAAMGRRGPLASEPCHFSNFFRIFRLPNFKI
jgi:hypothetical protein